MTTPARQVAALLDLGFSRRDLAKIMSTNVQSVALIARGDRDLSNDVYRLSQIDQLHRLAIQVFTRPAWAPYSDPAAWFEAPIVDGCPYTPMDLYVDGKLALVLGLAANLERPLAVLDEYDSDWRRFLDGGVKNTGPDSD